MATSTAKSYQEALNIVATAQNDVLLQAEDIIREALTKLKELSDSLVESGNLPRSRAKEQLEATIQTTENYANSLASLSRRPTPDPTEPVPDPDV